MILAEIEDWLSKGSLGEPENGMRELYLLYLVAFPISFAVEYCHPTPGHGHFGVSSTCQFC